MAVLKKKIWPQFFEKIQSGEKNFELRLADFVCTVGDILRLEEWDPKTKSYTGRVLEKEITYVATTKDQLFWSKEDVEKYGFQILGFK